MRHIHHSPSCTAIPDHILRHVAAHGDEASRANVEATLHQTVQIARDRAEARVEIPNGAAAMATSRREVYDAHHGRALPGKLVMNDQNTTSNDVEAMEAFQGAVATDDFFTRVFGRNSIDDKGMTIRSTVHYGTKFDNAMWDGKQMIYGDGDGKLFNRFTAAVDVIGHELTHGVTQNEAALEYSGQSGALNEHISDAFGIMVKQHALGQIASQSDWLIGAGLLGPSVRGKAIRSMKAPGTAYNDPVLGRDPQPAHMRNYVNTVDDNGGVHINSGIPNRAFYLAATELGGFVWIVLGGLWYRVLKYMLFPHAGFQDFATATVSAAGAKYGLGGTVQTAIAYAWSQVGLPVPALLMRQAPPPLPGPQQFL